MLTEKDKREIEVIFREIKEAEEAGCDVVAIRSNGELGYSTQELGNINDYCDQCDAFRLYPDPPLGDWFRDGDKKAVCLRVKGVIAGALERPSEWTGIHKPLYCPLLGRELSEEEKKEANKQLKWARERMK